MMAEFAKGEVSVLCGVLLPPTNGNNGVVENWTLIVLSGE
jgi:hypothetical protein